MTHRRPYIETHLPRSYRDGRLVSAPEAVELLDGGEHAYPRMLLAVAQAQRSVHLEVYAFAPLGVGARFVEALGKAARRGVTVRVLIDGWGSRWGGRAVAGCAVRIYNRLRGLLVGRFGRNHRKILLVDDEVAFLGGINIGNENLGEGDRLGWADLALEIRGPQCVRLLLAGRSGIPLALVGSFNLDPFSLANLEVLVEVDDVGGGGFAAAQMAARSTRPPRRAVGRRDKSPGRKPQAAKSVAQLLEIVAD